MIKQHFSSILIGIIILIVAGYYFYQKNNEVTIRNGCHKKAVIDFAEGARRQSTEIFSNGGTRNGYDQAQVEIQQGAERIYRECFAENGLKPENLY